MDIKQTHIKGLYEITSKLFEDNRGYFTEVFVSNKFKDSGIDLNIVQVNRSLSKDKGVVRGLHYQVGDYMQAKLVQCTRGRIFDVAVDLREGSDTYGSWYGSELSETNQKLLFIPHGFAHGLQVLDENSVIEYFMDSPYNFESEGGVIWNDQTINIDWPIKENIILSEKDAKLPSLNDHRKF